MNDDFDPEVRENVTECAVEAGLMIEFENPLTGDTALIPTAKLAMEMGYSRRDARQYVRDRIREFDAAGFRRVNRNGGKR